MGHNRRLEFTVDLSGVKSEVDIRDRFDRALGIFHTYLGTPPEKWKALCVPGAYDPDRDDPDYLSCPSSPGTINWDAFNDDIVHLWGSSVLVSPLAEKDELDEVVIYLKGFREIRYSISEEVRNNLADILLCATDKTNSQEPFELWVKVLS